MGSVKTVGRTGWRSSMVLVPAFLLILIAESANARSATERKPPTSAEAGPSKEIAVQPKENRDEAAGTEEYRKALRLADRSPAEAKELIQELLAKYPASPSVLAMAARFASKHMVDHEANVFYFKCTALGTRRTPKTNALLVDLLRDNPDCLWALLEAARIAEAEKRKEDAIEYCRRVLQALKKDPLRRPYAEEMCL